MQSLHLKEDLCVQVQVLRGQNFTLLGEADASCCPRPMHREHTGI